MRIFFTSDIHGEFRKIERFCHQMNTSKSDLLICMGELQLDYYTTEQSPEDYDYENKVFVESLPITIFNVRGNHENRPEKVKGYQLQEWRGGKVYVQEEFPSIKHAKTGEIYDFGEFKAIAIGGAYSPDRRRRIDKKLFYCIEELISEEEKVYVERQLQKHDGKIDVILSHTCPWEYVPREAFLPGIKQHMVDISMEQWLDTIWETTDYKHWFCGHYHIDKEIDKMHFVYEQFLEWDKVK